MGMTTRSDNDIQLEMIEEFVGDPVITASEICVRIHNGVVPLAAAVDSYVMKVAAERSAQRVDGVHSLTNDLTGRTLSTYLDTEIAGAAAKPWRGTSWCWPVPSKSRSRMARSPYAEKWTRFINGTPRSTRWSLCAGYAA